MKSALFGGARRIGGGRTGKAVLLILLSRLLVGPSELFAQPPADTREPELTGHIEFIQRALDEGAKSAHLWTWGWLGAYGGATAAQGAILFSSDDTQQRQDMAVGAVTSLIGAAGQVVFPLRTGRYASALRAMPEATLDDRRAKLTAAESWLRSAAKEQRFGKSWKSRAMALSINGAAGLVTSLAFDRPASDGLIVFGIGQAVSEVQMLTQPTRAIRDVEAYVKRTSATTLAPTRGNWAVAVGPARVSVTRSF